VTPDLIGIEDAQIHPGDVPVDAAITPVLTRVASQRVSSFLRGMERHLQDSECVSVRQKEEAFMIVIAL
jgi:hypothetical protein